MPFACSLLTQRFALDDRVALVIGGGANGRFGRAIALGLARAGARVAVADRDADGLAVTARELEGFDPAPLAHMLDVTRTEDVGRLFAALEREIGRLDILVCLPAQDTPDDAAARERARRRAVNLSGYVLCCQAALHLMRPAGQGSIINVGTAPEASSRGAAAAVHRMTREMAADCAGSGIRVNTLLPQGARLDSEDLVGPVVFLASEAARAVNGMVLPIEG